MNNLLVFLFMFVPRLWEPVDKGPTLYQERYRPQFHFTADRGWINDHREPYWLTYQRRKGSDRFEGSSKLGYDAPLILMTWGESYHYIIENF